MLIDLLEHESRSLENQCQRVPPQACVNMPMMVGWADGGNDLCVGKYSMCIQYCSSNKSSWSDSSDNFPTVGWTVTYQGDPWNIRLGGPGILCPFCRSKTLSDGRDQPCNSCILLLVSLAPAALHSYWEARRTIVLSIDQIRPSRNLFCQGFLELSSSLRWQRASGDGNNKFVLQGGYIVSSLEATPYVPCMRFHYVPHIYCAYISRFNTGPSVCAGLNESW